MMAEVPTYRIGTVLDFLQVPEDRREICVKEFLCWLDIAKNLPKMMEGIPINGPAEYIWIDDGLHRATATISDGTHKVMVVSGRIKGFD